MVETEMSLQSELIKSNTPELISSYSKIEIKDEDSNINTDSQVINDPSQIPSEQTPNENNNSKCNNNPIIINGSIYSVNSDQIRPIIHKYFYSKLGNTHTFFADEKGNPLIVIGPHWPLPVGVIITFTIIYFGIIIYFGRFISDYNLILGYILFFLFLVSYGLTMLLNPGYPILDENTLTNKDKDKTGYCSICRIWLSLEKKTKHCNFCNICIEGMDHHCPWTGKCIGRKNIIPFYLFLFAVFSFMTYCVSMILRCKNELNKSLKK